MVGRGCIIDITSYNPLIDALCRKGNFDKALELLSHMVQMGIVPDYSSWNSLLLCLCQETSNNMFRVTHLLQQIAET
jgi:pentatricopeptide repeat protein